jgi:diguanylate cyclase (GGDEF)-like protein/PAS domain S-box-containing protein
METGQDFYQALLEELIEGIYYVDRDRNILFWNRAAERITGFTKKEVIGKSCRDNLLIHVDDGGRHLCLDSCPLQAALDDGEPREAEVFLHHKDGHRVPVFVRICPIRSEEDGVVGAVELFSDNSARLEMTGKLAVLEREVQIDPLTQAANRRYTEHVLHACYDEYRRFSWPFAVLFVDVDNFKAVNDTFSHEIGDRVLSMVAKTLMSNVRSFDHVGRWGGEEFLVILKNLDYRTMTVTAEKLRLLVSHSIFWHGERAVSVTVSIGAALVNDRDDPASLVGRADRLMYQSKEGGRNRVISDYPAPSPDTREDD